MTEQDKLIDALVDATRMIQSSRRDALNDQYDEEFTAAREALSQYIEQRTLTARESSKLSQELEGAIPASFTQEEWETLTAKLRLISSPTEEPI